MVCFNSSGPSLREAIVQIYTMSSLEIPVGHKPQLALTFWMSVLILIIGNTQHGFAVNSGPRISVQYIHIIILQNTMSPVLKLWGAHRIK